MKKIAITLAIAGFLFGIGGTLAYQSFGQGDLINEVGAVPRLTGDRIERSSTDIVRVTAVEINPENLSVNYHFSRELYDGTSGDLLTVQSFEGHIELPDNSTTRNFLSALYTGARDVEIFNLATGELETIGGTVMRN